jgi:hypothetical protein
MTLSVQYKDVPCKKIAVEKTKSMNRLCCIPIPQYSQKAAVEYRAKKQPERCNTVEETLQDSNRKAILPRQSDSDYPLEDLNTADFTKMPLRLLELPLVLVRDILNHVVQSYTTHQSLSLCTLLSIKHTNRKSLLIHSHHARSDSQYDRFLQR